MGHKNLHSLFSEAAARFGNLTAVECGDKFTSYAELAERSNNLANFLVSSGAAKGTIIAILASKGPEVVVAITAVLKAGCVFVPLDPSMPPKRLQSLVAEVSPQWYLVESRFMPNIKEVITDEQALPRVVFLDNGYIPPETPDDWASAKHYADYFNPAPCAVETAPDEMCYIYFTSGSTGRPKGIMGRLSALDHFINWEIQTFEIAQGTRVSQFTSPSFDAFLRDVFVPLCAGGTVCVPASREIILDAGQLVDWIDSQRINLIHCVPTLFRSILNEKLSATLFPDLKSILLAGEPLHVSDVKKWMAVFDDRIQLVNLYGPSETTLVKFFYFVTPADLKRPSIPIGRPMKGARSLIMGPKGMVCPPGIVGEIYIRTKFRSLGYYNQPELTRESFVPNPINKDPSDIVYKTGDLGRVLEDGNFEILGRQDQQVKISGVRVELGEIESALRSHEAVKDVAVLSKEDANHNTYLCAYLVLKEDIGIDQLINYLVTQLPESMIPAVFMKLDEFPRTLTGKVDRKQLPDPARTRAGSESFVAARTPVEEMLASIWCDALKLERVSIHDNFFALGGHSLLATQVISRIRQKFNVELNLRSIFQAATISTLAEVVETLLRSGMRLQSPPITPVGRDTELPLSFAQRRLWFLEQLNPGEATYNMPVAVHLRGQLNLPALELSFNEIVRRHETLRTAFVTGEWQPLQVVSEPPRINIPVHDLGYLVENERAAAAQKLAEEEGKRPFNLSQSPLVRICLLRLSEQHHLLVVTMHHIVSDAWSLGILIEEVATLYQAFSRNETSPLSELPVQYADFAHWQRRLLQGEVLAAGLSYWKQQLAGAPAEMGLFTLRLRPPIQTYAGGYYSFEVPATLARSLQLLSQHEGVTLFMTLLAVFQTLLHRYTGRNDIVVGTPIAGRSRVETEGLIGFFVNTLVLRTDLSGDPSFQELLQRVREVALGAYAHQDIPFEILVEELEKERHLSRSPLVQVMFVLQNAPLNAVEISGLTIEPQQVHTGTSKFDLTLFQLETTAGISSWFEYDTDLFDEVTIARMAEHFITLLERCVTAPDGHISEWSFLTATERSQIFEEWNETGQEYPHDRCIHELFETQAEQTPEAIAFTDGEQILTYADLNGRANQVACYLKKRGIGPDVIVGICIDRSLEMMVGLLGILKAGGAYLPLDPAYPPARLAFMIRDSGTQVVLTVERLLDRIQDHGVEVISLDREWQAIAAESEANPVNQTTPDNLAYVIYTSGSTGMPKGVLGLHRGAVNRLSWMWHAYPFKDQDVCAQKTSLSFLDSLWEIFGPLLQGVNTVVISDEVLRDPESLVAVLERHGVTRIVLVPSFLRLLLEAVSDLQTRLPRLRLWVVSGEALSPELVRRFRESLPERVLLNLYGSSEVSADVTAYDTSSWNDVAPLVPIGRPIGNTKIYLLDSHLKPVPVGVAGDLYVGGAGLARGYLERAELTAERFIPDCFSSRPGKRLFKTGDIARYRLDGNIDYLGRVDDQVKIRGFRIELSEIGRTLDEHPLVAQSVVIARETAAGDKRLEAYLTLHEQQELHPEDLRRHLRQKLPEYMVPSFFNVLPALPLTASGKVDKVLLPSLNGKQFPSQVYVPPQTPTEETLARLCAELLGLDRVGMQDNFFQLGGHSLLAMQLVSRLRQLFQLDLPVRSLFEVSTLRELAQLIEANDELKQRNLDEIAFALDALEVLSEDEVKNLLLEKGATRPQSR